MQLNLANVSLCVIDEISMGSFSTFRHVCETLNKIKQNITDWGGVSIISIGNFYQLPPIGQSPVYSQPHTIHMHTNMSLSLWNDFIIHELDKVMCQKDV